MNVQALRLVQLITEAGKRAVGVPDADGESLTLLKDTASVYELAQAALGGGASLGETARERLGDKRESYDRVAAEQRLLPPLDHPDPAHCWVTGTGLTHRQSAQARDDMHKDDAAKKEAAAKPKTDSMRIYEMGVEGGKPPAGKIGVQPEWFYKGDGSCVVGSERPLEIPDFSLDGSEEPEVVGLYIIDAKGAPWRVGYTLGNELSDHIMERQNYLFLAHSKLRVCSAGPELLTGTLPDSVEGTSRVLRDGKVLWEKPVRSGEANMTHSLANLEHHHFKYGMFRRPGDVHVHYFGAMGLSFADGIRAKAGDVFELSVPLFGRPLRNPLAVGGGAAAPVRAL
jgi:hypothetical protein